LSETKQLVGEAWPEPVGHGFKSRPPYNKIGLIRVSCFSTKAET
jgi:hypothetical protein